ncbi:hypothetical protein CR513_25591, partial [Mucuna pruriens]
MQSFEERLRAIEGGDKYGVEVVDLCLVPDVRLPIDFKTLEFDKYKGRQPNWGYTQLVCQPGMRAH